MLQHFYDKNIMFVREKKKYQINLVKILEYLQKTKTLKIYFFS